MSAADPQIAGLRDRSGVQSGWSILRLLGAVEQHPWISNGERGQRQIEIKCLQFLQLEGDQFQIEGGPSGGTVRCKPERFYLRNGYAARNSSRSRLNVTRIASAGSARIGR